MQQVTPFLWFNTEALEAAQHYTAIFPRSRILDVSRMGAGKDAPVFSVTFTIDGRQYFALNGGPHYALNPAFSLFVSCKTQKEIDSLWGQLLAGGGTPLQCGWLTDRFGLTWQVIPDELPALMRNKDAMAAMMTMQKLDLARLRAAAGVMTKPTAKKPKANAPARRAKGRAPSKAAPKKKPRGGATRRARTSSRTRVR